MTDIARARVLGGGVLASAAVAPVASAVGRPLREGDVWSPPMGRSRSPRPHTREVNDGLETRFILSATCSRILGQGVRRKSYSNIYYLDAAQAGAGDHPLAGESEKYVRFFVPSTSRTRRGTTWRNPKRSGAFASCGGREGLRARLHPQVVPASGEISDSSRTRDVVPGVRGRVPAEAGEARGGRRGPGRRA